MSEYLVVGASGQTGHELVSRLRARGKNVAGTYCRRPFIGGVELDLRDPDSIDRVIRETAPRVIFIPAAETNVDQCERDPDAAREVNALGPARLAQAAAAAGAFVVLFSTDYVFDGEAGPYGEADAPNPINLYGRSKLEGEQAVAQSGARHSIVRTCVVFSYRPGHANFFMQVFNKLSHGLKITPFTDQFVNPTFASGLADSALEIADREMTGVVHIGGADWVSRLEFCRKLARRFGFSESLLEPVETSRAAVTARRPLKAGLKIDRARQELRTPAVGLDAAFDEIASKLPRSS